MTEAAAFEPFHLLGLHCSAHVTASMQAPDTCEQCMAFCCDAHSIVNVREYVLPELLAP